MIVALSSATNIPSDFSKAPSRPNKTVIRVNELQSAPSVAVHAAQSEQTLTLADRVAYQRSIEEVYWQHRIWPKENRRAKPSLDETMPQATIEKKVSDYLRNSQLLEQHWQKPITPEQLQAEMDRMARQTKQPDVLRELFAALGNDPAVIAECVARPALADRLLRNLYAHDKRFHGELKRRAEAELETHRAVEQMKKIDATYTEVEWVKTDGVAASDNTARQTDAIDMSKSEWKENIDKLAATFGSSIPDKAVENAAESAPSHTAGNRYEAIPIEKLSKLQEDDASYYTTAVITKSKDRIKVATVAWMKLPVDEWRAKAAVTLPVTIRAKVRPRYKLPAIATAAQNCADDTWTATSTTDAPDRRVVHSAVWTGSEMIVWGGQANGSSLNTGGRYNPSTDSWTATTLINAPDGRSFHTAVWTGSEMIVWGGQGNVSPYHLNNGGRYNPVSDSWTATSITNAPCARVYHTAVWTGSEMIVWGGNTQSPFLPFNTGGRYNPAVDSWTATSTTNAPSARTSHTAVWTSSQMIIWGGGDDNDILLNTGGRYDPDTDNWTATSTTNAPSARFGETAVWTGSEMIIWGGEDQNFLLLNTGGRYNSGNDSWTATSTTNAPSARNAHAAVWTDSHMIVWGGYDGSSYLNTGGRYNPGTDSWTVTSTANAPDARSSHTSVWTGSQMVAWGGFDNFNNYLNTGGKYCAASGGDLFASINGNAQNGGGSIFQYTPAGAQTTFLSSLDRPRGVAFDNDNNLFAATTTLDPNSGNASAAILRIAPDGTQTTFANISGPSVNFFAEDAKFDAAGNLFVMVADLNDPAFASTIYEFDPTGAQSTFGTMPGDGFGLAFDSVGNLYAADSIDQTVYKFAPDGTRTVFIGPSAFSANSGPVGLAFDQSGNLFVSGASEILKFTPSAAESTFATGLNGERGLAFDSAGNLFVAEVPSSTQGDILKFAPDGTGSVFASGLGRPEGNGGAEYLAFQRASLIKAVSQMTHGGAGTFDIDLPLAGNPGIECRSGGTNRNYTLVFTFANTLTNVTGASVSGGTGSVTSSNIDSSDAHNYIVNLSNVANAQYITVSLTNVTDATGNFTGLISTTMAVLVGDTNADGSVNSSDVSQTKSKSGQNVTSGNFREDVSADGTINSADISLVKSKSGLAPAVGGDPSFCSGGL